MRGSLALSLMAARAAMSAADSSADGGPVAAFGRYEPMMAGSEHGRRRPAGPEAQRMTEGKRQALLLRYCYLTATQG